MNESHLMARSKGGPEAVAKLATVAEPAIVAEPAAFAEPVTVAEPVTGYGLARGYSATELGDSQHLEICNRKKKT